MRRPEVVPAKVDESLGCMREVPGLIRRRSLKEICWRRRDAERVARGRPGGIIPTALVTDWWIESRPVQRAGCT